MNENAASYEFISAKKLGMPVQIKAETSDPGMAIINQVITVSKEQEKHCALNIDIQAHNTLRLFGCVVQNDKPQLMKFAITDPIWLAKQVIKNTLDKNGILLKGHIIDGKTPADATIVASFPSKNLIELITHMLQESDNLYASSLYKELAYSVTGEGTYKQGSFAIKKILGQHTHLDISQIKLADGSGTRYSLVTPEQVVRLLTNLHQDKNLQAVFLNALPQAGISGTLKDRMQKTNLAKKIFAKTGTMHDVSSLSGYLLTPNTKTIIFSIIINGVNEPISTAKTLEEKILLLVADEQT